MKIIINGFKTTGIYPFDLDAIKKEKLMPTNTAAFPSAPGPSSTIDSPTTSCLIEHENSSVTPMPNTSTNQSSNVSFPIDSFTPSCLTPVHRNLLVTRGLILASLVDVSIAPKQEKSAKTSSWVIIKARVLTSEEWLNKIQAKEIEKEEKEKANKIRKIIKNKKETKKRKKFVVKKKKSVDNNWSSTSYQDYPVSEYVETTEKCHSKEKVQKKKYTYYNLSSSESESE